MEKETWKLMLNSCNNNNYNNKQGYNNNYNKSDDNDDCIDRLSDLPDDLLLKIISSLSTMEVIATFRRVSSKFNYLCRFLPDLIFDNPKSMKRLYNMRGDYRILVKETSNFVKWGDRVIGDRLGGFVNEFKVKFEVYDGIQSTIDKWLAFALAKQVKSITLDCVPSSWLWRDNLLDKRYTFPVEPMLSRDNSQLKFALTYLYLSNVNISDETMECLLESFSCLEHLRIYLIKSLNQIRVSDTSVSLKYLEVEYSLDTKSISLSSTKLETFKYTGDPVELHITKAPLLSDVSIGTHVNQHTSIEYAFNSLSAYYIQLEHLQLKLNLSCAKNCYIHRSLSLPKLKHLELAVCGGYGQSLIGWVNLIKACPVLQKLTLKVESITEPMLYNWELVSALKCPIECLRTLEIVGFIGACIDLELSMYVLERAIMLEEVIVDVDKWHRCMKPFIGAREQAMKFKQMIPDNVKFILK